MKHLKTFENRIDNLDDIENDLLKILNKELYTSYGSITNDGMNCAVNEIIEYLKKLGIDLDLYSNSKKYNI